MAGRGGPAGADRRRRGPHRARLVAACRPRSVATAPWWVAAIDAWRRRVLPGVRTRGQRGPGPQGVLRRTGPAPHRPRDGHVGGRGPGRARAGRPAGPVRVRLDPTQAVAGSDRDAGAGVAVQTFLPYADFAASAAVLDKPRLGKQRVEALQVLRALTYPTYGWKRHPAVRMWAGFERGVAACGLAVCRPGPPAGTPTPAPRRSAPTWRPRANRRRCHRPSSLRSVSSRRGWATNACTSATRPRSSARTPRTTARSSPTPTRPCRTSGPCEPAQTSGTHVPWSTSRRTDA